MQTVSKQLVHVQLKDPVHIGTMTSEAVHVGKKVKQKKQQEQYVFMLELAYSLVRAVNIPKLGEENRRNLAMCQWDGRKLPRLVQGAQGD